MKRVATLAAILLTPTLAFAQVGGDSIGVLQSSIDDLQHTIIIDCVPTFTRDLYQGLSGPDVECLQDILLAEGFSIPAGHTGYFGAQTRAALSAFQTIHKISPTAGYFGSITRGVFGTL